jgi:hypothetical protein
LWGRAQGTDMPHDRHRLPGIRLAVLLSVALVVSGCGGGFSLDRFGADRSLKTGAVGKGYTRPDSRASDEAAINATITAWMPGMAPPDAMPWVNSNTGSSGAIVRIADSAERGRQCRIFTVSRESFDGVSLYRGKACSANGGPWKVEMLEQGQFQSGML